MQPVNGSPSSMTSAPPAISSHALESVVPELRLPETQVVAPASSPVHPQPGSGISRAKGRKGYRKSHQGCFNCKKRKIKVTFAIGADDTNANTSQCQETFPTCANCSRASLRCHYTQASAIISLRTSTSPQGALSATPSLSFIDVRLFHHYLVAAFPHFPLASEDIWLNYITPISHQSDFLMHALLALSASHLSKISDAKFVEVARSHRLKASKGLNEALNGPLVTVEEGDAVIAASHALLLQSWYMDDGLNTFLVLTRTCDLVSQQVQAEHINALFAKGHIESAADIMRERLQNSLTFDTAFIHEAAASMNAILPLCSKLYQQDCHECLMNNILTLSKPSIIAYQKHANICKLIATISHEDFCELCDPRNTVCQLLLAHLVALHLVMRPISCRERKKYTVTMYRIRMSTWIDTIYQNIPTDHKKYLIWPLTVSKLHRLGTLEQYILSH